MTAAQVEGADLVLTAERAHRARIAALATDAPARTFTLLEFARLATAMLPAEPPDAWELVAAAASARGQFPPAEPGLDDLPDPVVGDLPEHEHVVAMLQQATTAIAAALQQVDRQGRQARMTGRHSAAHRE